MSNFAIIPWTETYANDRMFERTDSTYINGLLLPYIEFKKEFEMNGHQIHTVDKYENYSDVDFFLFFTLNWEMYHKIVSAGMSEKMVYCTAEPPSVYRYNTPEGYRVLKRIFPYIMTWNDEWVDNRSIFKRNIPYHFEDLREGNLGFKEKKLITSISGNKHSDYVGELYSEREKAISYFENYHSEEFDFYGTGWDGSLHPCYKGRVEDKSQIYHKYRFAICYENIEGLSGYITEKILDCIVSGIVPIYAGSIDIEKYIPSTCFIKLRDFSDYDQLYSFLMSIREEEYNNYLKEADEFLNSPMADFFSGARYADYIMDAIQVRKRFKSSKFFYRVFKYKYRRKR